MVVESFPSWGQPMERRRTLDSSKKPYESPVPHFAERVMWKDPTLQPANLRSSWVYGLWLGRPQTSNAHLIGTRMGIVVARTIRRLPKSELKDSNLMDAMDCTPVAGRPADAAAGDAPTVTRHAVERREVNVVLAILWRPTASGAAAKASVYFPIQFQSCLSRQSRGHNQHRLQWNDHPSGERVDSCGPGGDVPLEVAPAMEPTMKSRAPVEEHDESLVPKRERGRPATHYWSSPGSPEMASTLRKTRWKNFSFDEVVEDVNRELDLMKSFPVNQAVPSFG